MNRISEGIALGTWCWIKFLHILLIIMAQELLLYPVGWKTPRACVLTKCSENNRRLPKVTRDPGNVTTVPTIHKHLFQIPNSNIHATPQKI